MANYKTGAQRYNDRMGKIFDRAKSEGRGLVGNSHTDNHGVNSPAMKKARTEAIKKKTPSLNEMHNRSAQDFKKLSPQEQEAQAKSDRDKSRAEMIKKLEAAGDFESVRALKGQK